MENLKGEYKNIRLIFMRAKTLYALKERPWKGKGEQKEQMHVLKFLMIQSHRGVLRKRLRGVVNELNT